MQHSSVPEAGNDGALTPAMAAPYTSRMLHPAVVLVVAALSALASPAHAAPRYRDVGDAEEVAPVAVRVASVFRLESEGWKLVHRHADPITSPRPATSVISK